MSEEQVGSIEKNKSGRLLLGWKVDERGHPFFCERKLNGEFEKIYGYGKKTGHPILAVENDNKWTFKSNGSDETSWTWPISAPQAPLLSGAKEVDAKHLETHTLIVAQSGSGKSFFLGRLIEEILLKTRARCLVLDPNGDFRLARKVRESSYWKFARYEPEDIQDLPPEGKNWLRTEGAQQDFAKLWDKVTIQAFPDQTSPDVPRISLPWELLDVGLIAPTDQPVVESQLRFAAKIVGLLNPLAGLLDRASDEAPSRTTLLDLAKRLVACELSSEGSFRESWTKIDRQVSSRAKFKEIVATWDQRNRIEDAVTAWRFSSPEALRLFISALEEGSRGVLDFSPRPVGPYLPSSLRLGVLDLPALDAGRGQESLRLLAVQCFMKAVWRDAYELWQRALPDRDEVHERGPTFIVVDEAHNLIPASQSLTQAGAVVRESFRRIAAEGRKFGLFLILVSQRPDKLDPLVASECANSAIMRLSGRTALVTTKDLLGISALHSETERRILELGKGRFFLHGGWAGEDARDGGEAQDAEERRDREAKCFAYAAARRTLEGGANIPKSWRSLDKSFLKTDVSEECLQR